MTARPVVTKGARTGRVGVLVPLVDDLYFSGLLAGVARPRTSVTSGSSSRRRSTSTAARPR